MSRTALFIRCATVEADKIRVEAEKERRTISAYVLQVVIRATELDDRLYSRKFAYTPLNRDPSRNQFIEPGPRTAILVRCDESEARRIRDAAQRRNIPINAFVLHTLKRAWNVQGRPPESIIEDAFARLGDVE